MQLAGRGFEEGEGRRGSGGGPRVGLHVEVDRAAGTDRDSPGLRDSVRRDETGLLVRYGDDAALALALTRVLEDGALRERLARGGIAWSRRFDWTACGNRSLDALAGTAAAS